MTKIHFIQENFDSGFRGTYKGYHIDCRLVTSPNSTSPICIKLLKYQTPSKYINPLTIALVMFDTITYLNQIIETSFQYNYKLRTTKNYIGNIFYLNNQKEQIVHIMKRLIDDLIMILCTYHDYTNIQKNNEICISSIGDLKNKTKYNNKEKINKNLILQIKNELNYEKYKTILNVINDLHNAYKHSCLMNSSHLEFNPTGVSLSAYYAKYNKLDNIYYLNHNMIHVVVGFSDFLLEFFDIENSKRKHLLLTTKKDIDI